ncbi:hypothetical protein ATANTOWER_012384 [Ataeniobius toweri]|uniref:Uncharacterized protein n=1 Tax=Ataeniobius toweri TaxID=208326 RepID=A0ABU7B6K9_9TELE|nr:hypothetical protein [Ataeniobius toweri]
MPPSAETAHLYLFVHLSNSGPVCGSCTFLQLQISLQFNIYLQFYTHLQLHLRLQMLQICHHLFAAARVAASVCGFAPVCSSCGYYFGYTSGCICQQHHTSRQW